MILITALLCLSIFLSAALLTWALLLRRRVGLLTNEQARLVRGLRLFAIRGNWTLDQGRGSQPRWTDGTAPWLRARRAMGDHWVPGKSEVTE